MKNFFAKNSCRVKNKLECTDKIAKKCKVSEYDCQVKKDYCEKKQRDKTPQIKIILILLTILGVAASFILKQCSEEYNQIRQFFANILEGLAVSCAAGLVITYSIDIRSKLKEYEISFLNALSSNNYVRQLSKGQLLQLRLDVTKALHYKNSPNISNGLIHLDNDICELLDKVYCIKYRQTTICSIIPEKKGMVKKKNNVEYVLVNPHQDDIEEVVAFRNLYKKDTNDSLQEYFPEFHISFFSKDDEDSEYKEIINQDNDKYCLKEGKRPNPDKEFYNASVYYGHIDNNEVGRKVRFKYKLKVSISFTIITPIDDICFTKRVKHPTSNFRLDYFYDSNDVKLYGQLFGTNIEQSEVSVVNISDNKISLETSEWLLPRDGAIIVATRKKK